jgi:sterol desaturase/sphingolipid hydroxylase (fatty acid hydroxylase superfamily)
MTETIFNAETTIRLAGFFGIFLIVAVWEMVAARRPLHYSKAVRWYSNLGITTINGLLLQLIFPILAVSMAAMGQERSWGLFNNFSVPFWLAFVLSLLILDFVIYLQHLMFHQVPALWLLHRMHHTDLDYDVTTGSRFHPIEIILSMLIKFSAIVVIGPAPFAVLIFEIVLNATAMFNHGNIRIPVRFDRYLRWFVVTPDMHRVHHSIHLEETNSNYGFNVPWWDRLMGTYTAQPRDGHDEMTIGIEIFRDKKYLHLARLLLLPFLISKDGPSKKIDR